MKTEKGLEVYLGSDKVGILVETSNHKVAFSYSDVWLEKGFSISPFSLPLKGGVLFLQSYILMDYLVYLPIVFQMHGAVTFRADYKRAWREY